MAQFSHLTLFSRAKKKKKMKIVAIIMIIIYPLHILCYFFIDLLHDQTPSGVPSDQSFGADSVLKMCTDAGEINLIKDTLGKYV